MNRNFLVSFLIAAVILGTVTHYAGHDEAKAEAGSAPVTAQSVTITVHPVPGSRTERKAEVLGYIRERKHQAMDLVFSDALPGLPAATHG